MKGRRRGGWREERGRRGLWSEDIWKYGVMEGRKEGGGVDGVKKGER